MTTNTPPPSRRGTKRSPKLEGLAFAALLVLPVLLYGASEPLTLLLLGLMALLMVGLIVL